MAQILTLVADRAATSLTPAIVARARDAAGGAEPVTLSPGEAVDLKLADAADLGRVAGGVRIGRKETGITSAHAQESN